METKQFVCSNPNLILTQPTCGQRSSMSAKSKRRAPAFYFSIRICRIFLTSKCRRELDLGLCITSALAKKCYCRVATSDWKPCLDAKFDGICQCAVAFCLQVSKLCTNLNPTLIYILIFGTCGKFARKNKMLAHLVCFQQPCSSAGRSFCSGKIMFTLLLTNDLFRFHKNEFDEMPCEVEFTENPC